MRPEISGADLGRRLGVTERHGLAFPPVSWDQAWTHIAAMARGALDVLREEIHAGLPDA